jgi:hypothetical protein
MELPHSASVTIDDNRVCSILNIFLLFDGDGDMRTWRAGEWGGVRPDSDHKVFGG